MKIKRYTAGPFLTNTYLIINNDEALVVDPTIGLDKYINDINNYKIKGVLLTHGHIDHIATVNLFDCKVYIYEDEVNKLYNNHLNLCDMFGYDFQFENHEIVKLKNNDVILFSGKEIKVIHTPGHTNGSISFVIDNMIFMLKATCSIFLHFNSFRIKSFVLICIVVFFATFLAN